MSAEEGAESDVVERLQRYALARTLKCGWDAALPAVERAVQVSQASVDGFGDEAAVLAFIHPGDMVLSYIEEMDELDDEDAWLRPLRLGPDEHAAAMNRAEEAIPLFIEFLTRNAVDNPKFHGQAQIALIAHEARVGEVAAARGRLERLAGDSGDSELAETLDELRRALDSTPPGVPTAADWVLDRTDNRLRRLCGFAQLASGIDPSGLRAGMFAAQGDHAAAIAVLLRNEWLGPSRSGVTHLPRLLPLLRQRYTAQALRQGWLDAEGSIRIEGEQPGFLLYGVELPLPRAVRENDPADAARIVERPLRRDEAVAYLREWSLYAALFPRGLPRR